MTEKDDIARRFDEAFRTILVIVTITVSFCLSFYKESLTDAFFLNIFVCFVVSIILWGSFHIVRGKYEYVFKLLAWHFLLYDMALSFFVVPMTLFSFSLSLTQQTGWVPLAAITVIDAALFYWFRERKLIAMRTRAFDALIYTLVAWTALQACLVITSFYPPTSTA